MDSIVPVIGSAGFYEFSAPFNALAIDKVEYVCKAVRRISDLIANNEDPKVDIYDKNAIADTYEDDVKKDICIVSLQSRTGHWLYVPQRYILSYPSPNGVRYHSTVLTISLPPMPVDQDLKGLTNDIGDLVKSQLGVEISTNLVEASKVVLVSKEKHDATQLARRMKVATGGTLHSKVVSLTNENVVLREKLTLLENYIKNTLP